MGHPTLTASMSPEKAASVRSMRRPRTPGTLPLKRKRLTLIQLRFATSSTAEGATTHCQTVNALFDNIVFASAQSVTNGDTMPPNVVRINNPVHLPLPPKAKGKIKERMVARTAARTAERMVARKVAGSDFLYNPVRQATPMTKSTADPDTPTTPAHTMVHITARSTPPAKPATKSPA